VDDKKGGGDNRRPFSKNELVEYLYPLLVLVYLAMSILHGAPMIILWILEQTYEILKTANEKSTQ